MEIAIATGNKDKLVEIRDLLNNPKLSLKLPKDYGIKDFEVEENGKTLEENSFIKARALFKLVKIPTIADDTGLFVNVLNGEPGIYSHRYAGENPTYADNRKKLLSKLSGEKNRSAYFVTAICFIDENGKDHYFLGKEEGLITEEEIGNMGFGYDMIFKPLESDLTYAQMNEACKNKIGHRGKAIEKFKIFLENTYDI